MLALCFNVGELRLALIASAVVEVLPRHALRPLALAPRGVTGLIMFRGALVPVIDLCRLVLDRDCLPLLSSRLMMVSIPHGDGHRLVGLLAENVLDLVPVGETISGVQLADAPWLGDHLADQPEMPQLLDPARLLPEELAALYEEAAGA